MTEMSPHQAAQVVWEAWNEHRADVAKRYESLISQHPANRTPYWRPDFEMWFNDLLGMKNENQ